MINPPKSKRDEDRPSKSYAQALEKQGCPVTLIEVSEADHFDMLNELANTRGELYKAVMEMIKG